MRAVLLALSATLLIGATTPGVPRLRMFDAAPFTNGLWRLSPLDDDWKARMPQGRSMCIVDYRTMFGTGFEANDSAVCTHLIVENSDDRATITYTCRGAGYGRATVRRDGADAFIVEAQGISARLPFDLKGEYKRVAACASYR